LFVRRKSWDIFAVLKGAWGGGWGAGAPLEEEGRQWDLIPILKYSIKKTSISSILGHDV
jgi:hypothetical protein